MILYQIKQKNQYLVVPKQKLAQDIDFRQQRKPITK